jgi:ferric-dicitrate binding protein FerR (iron transport regulator)
MNTRTCLAALLALWPAVQATAQVPPNCTAAAMQNPPRTVLTCGGTLVIEMDAAAQLGLVNTDDDSPPRRVRVNKGSVLIDVEPGSAAPQIRSAHAIAAVRGTVFAVDVSDTTTSVFVLEGMVNVKKPGSLFGAVDVKAGEGVDVSQDAPLEVKTWGEARVRALLSRFGR